MSRFTQLEPHQVRPAGQQWLLEHTLVPPQFIPQVPQFAASVARLWQPSPQHVLFIGQLTPHDWQWRVSIGTQLLLQQRPVPQSAHAPPQWRASFA